MVPCCTKTHEYQVKILIQTHHDLCSLRIYATFSCEVIHTSDGQETGHGWMSGVRLYIMPGLPTHLVQELHVVTVRTCIYLSMCVCMYVCMYVCVYICMYVCIYVYSFVYVALSTLGSIELPTLNQLAMTHHHHVSVAGESRFVVKFQPTSVPPLFFLTL